MAESTEKQVQQRPAQGRWHSDHLCMVAARMKNQERWIPVSQFVCTCSYMRWFKVYIFQLWN